jgi:hypothetical protein
MLVIIGPVNRWSVVNRFLAFITASMAMFGEKLGGGPTKHLAGVGFVLGALFLESSRL